MARDVDRYGGPATIEDLETISDEINRYELVGGEILVTPPPSEWHQDVVYQLLSRLGPVCEERGLKARDARGVFFPHTGEEIIPDLVVYRPGGQPLRTVYLAPKDVVLAVEVVSYSTRNRDRYDKPRLCASQGIPFYLLVDPFPEPVRIVLYGLADSSYDVLAEVKPGGLLSLPPPIDTEVDTTGLG